MSVEPKIGEMLGDTQKLPPVVPVVSPSERPTVVVEVAAQSDPGKVRKNNEDQYLVARLSKTMEIWDSSLTRGRQTLYSEDEGYLLIVADGMGGAAAGEQASAQAIATVQEFVLNSLKWFLQFSGEEHVLVGELRAALKLADRDVIERAWANPYLAGMGTTLTMGYSLGTDLYIVHAGDSRAYLLRDGELTQITQDHTLVQLMVNGGLLTPEDARTHKRRNVVTNVLGGPNPGVHAEIHKVPLEDGDVLLLCSDGLTEVVPDEAIARTLIEASSPTEASRLLVNQAREAGGPDNITTILARYRITPPEGLTIPTGL